MTQELIQHIIDNDLGQKWENYGHKRVYLNWLDIIGFKITYYNTGNISSARHDGEKVSNTRAREIVRGKAYIDLMTNELVTRNFISKYKEILVNTLDNMELS